MKRKHIRIQLSMFVILCIFGCNKPHTKIAYEFTVPQMTTIPSGSFTMGQVFNQLRLGYPLHTVNISNNFMLGTYEITNAQYCQMLNYALAQNELTGNYKDNIEIKNAKGYSQVLLNLAADYKGIKNDISFDKTKFIVSEGKDNLPIVYVSWYGAAFYCNMLSRKQELEETYNLDTWNTNFGNGYRLPTEAEWEYAVRYPDGRTFPWGNNFDSEGNKTNFGLNVGALSPVDSFEHGKSHLGLYNMVGNAEEWVNDFYATYPSDTITDPTGPENGVYKQKRGGSWYKHDNNLPFCAYRYNTNYQYTYYFDIGFRICLNAKTSIN